jgi:GNAT superfamily N-acetyltransferase
MGSVELDIARVAPDSEVATRLLRRYVDELASRFPGGFEIEAGEVSPKELIPPNGAFFVAFLAGQPVGCGAVRKLDDVTAEIKRMWTDPTVRGRGVARALLSRLEDAARELGGRAVRLDTSAHLPEAVALYHSSGYEPIAAYNDNPYAAHWFEKRPLAEKP